MSASMSADGRCECRVDRGPRPTAALHVISVDVRSRQKRPVVIGNRRCYRKQLRSACFGGQGKSPYEQNTQQSPGSGFSTVPQDGQSQKNWQASVGMDVRVAVPHSGHVIVLSSTGVRCDLSNGLSAMIKTMRSRQPCIGREMWHPGTHPAGALLAEIHPVKDQSGFEVCRSAYLPRSGSRPQQARMAPATAMPPIQFHPSAPNGAAPIP